MLLFLVYYRIHSSLVISESLKKHIAAHDYALEIRNLPRYGLTQEEVRTHFEKRFGSVCEVAFARIYEGMLKLYTKRSDLDQKKGKEVLKLKSRNKD